MNGFFNRILNIDLDSATAAIEALDDEPCRRYLGAKGLASWLLAERNPAGVDPLAPDNLLVFATGPVTGTMVWGSSRYGVFTKSPLTGLYAESYCGGKVPEAISATGFDAIVIKGRASCLSVMVITDQGAEIHPAPELAGKDTFATEAAVAEKYIGKTAGGQKAGTVVIGPAAENGVRFGVIKNNGWRVAARTGTGTVLGSKNVKAIVFKGGCRRPVHDGQGLRSLYKQLAAEARDNPIVKAYKSMGTSQMVNIMNAAGAFPTGYWKRGTCAHKERINTEALHGRCRVRPHACAKCYLSCGRMTTVKTGRHAGLQIEGPEYETIYAFGGLCMIDSIEEIIHLNHLCDAAGMDTITTGNLCAFAMEARRLGKSDYPVDFGDADATAELIRLIADCRGVGKILAGGIRQAAAAWDMQNEAVHVKGLEPAGYDPRVLKGMGLGYATSGRGACHLRATFYKPELSGLIAPDKIEGKARLYIDYEDRLTIFDTLVLCRFYRDIYTWQMLGQLVEAATGIRATEENLRQIAARISSLVRNFNLREGMDAGDETLPAPFYRPLEDSGARISKEQFRQLLSDYLALRKWRPA